MEKGGCGHGGDSWEKLIPTNTEKTGILQGPPAEQGCRTRHSGISYTGKESQEEETCRRTWGRCCMPAADRAPETNAALSQEPYVPREKNETQFLGADPPLGVYLQKPSFQRDK